MRHCYGHPFLACVPAAVAIGLWLFVAGCEAVQAQSAPPWKEIEVQLDDLFADLEGWEQHDLVSRRQVKAVLDELQQLFGELPDADALLEDTLDDQDFLVVQLTSPAGRRFMRSVSEEKLIYDRLDRIAREAGGPALIRNLIRLPDGEVFVRSSRAATVPGLLELLPKRGNGKSRRVRDFDKPTGKIYTAEHLKGRLQAIYDPQASGQDG
jgi:hypothetical protein